MALTDNELIDLLGGSDAVARLCGVTRRTAQFWLVRGIPTKGLRTYLIAELRGKISKEIRAFESEMREAKENKE